MLDRLPKEKKTGSFPLAGARTSRAARERSRRFTLLSFQRPRRLCGNKKPLTRTRGSRGRNTDVVSARSKALQSSSYRLPAPSFRKAEGW